MKWLPACLPTIEMVLVKGEFRPVGVLHEDEIRELERAHEDGDIRAEETLRQIMTGRRRASEGGR